MKKLAAALALFAWSPVPAAGSIWPTAEERLEKQLASAEPEVRRAAARRLSEHSSSVTHPLIERALSDPDVEVRLAAAQAAASERLPGLGERVFPWLSDAEPRIRLLAAEVLEQFPTPRALGALARASSDSDQQVRAAVVRALAASGSAEATLPLLSRLDDPAPEVRREVAAALGWLGDPRAVVPLLAKVEDTVVAVRREVVRALGQLGDARAVSALVLVLRDTDESVRVAALAALGRLGDGSAAPAAIALLSGTGPTRRAAAQALGRLATHEAIAALVAELGREPFGEGRAALVNALEASGNAALPALRDCVTRAPLAPAEGCVEALGRLGDASDVERLRDALERGRLSAAAVLGALGELGERAALPSVLEWVAVADPRARAAARAALERLLDPRKPDGRAVDPLEKALSRRRLAQSEEVELLSLLGQTGSPRAVDPLSRFAGPKSPPALAAASLRALGQLGAGAADAVLVAGLDHERAEVRMAAAISLRRAGAGRLARQLLDRLERSAEEDRVALGLALPGPVSRSSDPTLAARLELAVRGSRGRERDTLIEALGEAPGASAALGRLAAAADARDRLKVAEVLAGRDEAVATLRALSRDVVAPVRAAAVWSLGTVAAPGDLPALTEALGDPDGAVSANAAAALGRAAARNRVNVSAALCPLLDARRAYLRANALVAMRLSDAKCPSEPVVRLLLQSPSGAVRRAAAAFLARPKATKAEVEALLRCAAEDESERVARACEERKPSAPERAEPVLVYVVPAGELEPIAGAAFALELADGSYRLGVADRRGAVYERRAPAGEIKLGLADLQG